MRLRACSASAFVSARVAGPHWQRPDARALASPDWAIDSKVYCTARAARALREPCHPRARSSGCRVSHLRKICVRWRRHVSFLGRVQLSVRCPSER